MKFISLSKSKIKQGLMCKKALHLAIHQPKLGKYSTQSQKSFANGLEVGKIARSLFPGGILINNFKWKDKMDDTVLALKTKKVIFEATFSYNSVPIQVDILEPTDKGYNLIEVKSGLSVKDDYIEDAAIQLYVLQGKKIVVDKVFIWHINKQAGSEKDLFTKVDVTDKVLEAIKKVPEVIKDLTEMVNDEKTIPDVKIGSHCMFPYECPFRQHCWKNIPDTGSIFQIPYFPRKWEAFNDGVISLTDPKLADYGIRKEIIESVLNHKMWINKEAIAEELQKWTYPISSLDFETLLVNLPSYSHSYPYQQIPFQFSLDVLNKDESLDHFEYLHQTDSDPREQIAKTLVESTPKTGTILAYNGKFEIQVCRELAEMFPEYKEDLEGIIARIVDPWLLIKEHLYHPEFESSYSLKSVAPALLGKGRDYDLLTIKDGLQAQEAYSKLLQTSNLLEKIEINKNLRTYCQADTYNLILIFLFLKKESNITI